MFRPFRYLHRHVYPHGQPPQSLLRGSGFIFGTTIVILGVVGSAYAIEQVLF